MPARVDPAIVALARRQHGLVHVRQLRALPLDTRAIRRRVSRGWLIDHGDGLFQAGPLLGPHALEMAALLRYGARSTISDHTAAAAWQLRERRPGAPIDLTVDHGVAKRPGVRLRRRTLQPDDRTTHEGLHITTPARTIADLSTSVPAAGLQRLIEEAQLRRLATRAELESYDRGRPALREALQLQYEPSITRSEAERRLLELTRAAGLPSPQTNVRLEGLEVDLLWREQRLVVEVDGYEFHGSRAAFERDRARDARLLAAGYRVLRITWRQLTQKPERVIALLAAALTAR